MRIVVPVIFIHLLFVLALLTFHSKENEKKTHTPIKVHQRQPPLVHFEKKEMVIEEPIPEEVAESIPPPVEEVVMETTPVEEAPVEAPVVEAPIVSPVVEIREKPVVETRVKPAPPPPKKEIAKKAPPKPQQATPKKAKPTAAAAPKKPTPTPPPAKNRDREKLYALMQESLKNLDKPKASTAPSKGALPTKISALASEALKFEASYQSDLISLLEDKLEFPEKGKVKIKLTLTKEGNFKSVEVVHSDSEKNTKYLQKSLQGMNFPSLQKFFPKEEAHTFSITLTSEKSR